MKISTWLLILKSLSFQRTTKFRLDARVDCQSNYINLDELRHNSSESGGGCSFVTREKKVSIFNARFNLQTTCWEIAWKHIQKKYKFSAKIEKMFKWNNCIIICDIRMWLRSKSSWKRETSSYLLCFLIMEWRWYAYFDITKRCEALFEIHLAKKCELLINITFVRSYHSGI